MSNRSSQQKNEIANVKSSETTVSHLKMSETTVPITKSGRCYTCKPRGKVKKYIITQTDKFIFHHDMNYRPVILVTPIVHIKSIDEFSPEDLSLMFREIKQFCGDWNIEDYQVSYNCGAWKLNEHFHVKIRINDKVANRMRGDHFKFIKLSENHK
jgi:diadenosine tetraphosphate (Ap4A) HIT family hydrolase